MNNEWVTLALMLLCLAVNVRTLGYAANQYLAARKLPEPGPAEFARQHLRREAVFFAVQAAALMLCVYRFYIESKGAGKYAVFSIARLATAILVSWSCYLDMRSLKRLREQ